MLNNGIISTGFDYADCTKYTKSGETFTPNFVLSGINPVFDETFEFQLAFPELALIRFVTLDDECTWSI